MRRKQAAFFSLTAIVLAAGTAILVQWHKTSWAACHEDLRMIYVHCCMWAPGGAEEFLPSLAVIAGQYPDDPIVPRLKRYHYVAELNAASPPESVLCYCDREHHTARGGAILFVDGTVQWFPSGEFDKIVHVGKKMKGPNNAVHGRLAGSPP